jgi:hypothetical protein
MRAALAVDRMTTPSLHKALHERLVVLGRLIDGRYPCSQMEVPVRQASQIASELRLRGEQLSLRSM